MQCHGSFRVITCLGHELRAVVVRFTFRITTEFLRDEARCKLPTGKHCTRILLITGTYRCSNHCTLQQHTTLDALGPMTSCGMRDFMSNHSRKFCLVREFREQATIHR